MRQTVWNSGSSLKGEVARFSRAESGDGEFDTGRIQGGGGAEGAVVGIVVIQRQSKRGPKHHRNIVRLDERYHLIRIEGIGKYDFDVLFVSEFNSFADLAFADGGDKHGSGAIENGEHGFEFQVRAKA